MLYDTEALTLSVTPDRMTYILEILEEWLKRNRASKKDVQSLLGKLNFIVSFVRPGRVFMSGMLTFLRSMPDRGVMELSRDFLKDVLWWQMFLPQYNGVSMMAIDNWLEPDEVYASDACLKGCGAWLNIDRHLFVKNSFISMLWNFCQSVWLVRSGARSGKVCVFKSSVTMKFL